MLHEVICKHIASLKDADTFNFLRCSLFKPQKAPQHLLNYLAQLLEVPASALTCKTSCIARHSVRVVASVEDCILYKAVGGGLGAGEVWSNFELEGELAVLVQAWTFVSEAHGAAVWEISEDLEVVFSEDIIDTVIWCKHSATQVKTLIPVDAGRD